MRKEHEQRKNEERIYAGFQFGILSTNLVPTELAWSTSDTDYQQKVFLRDKEHKLNENHL